MKNLILLCICIAALVSCTKDADDNNAGLEGKWILVDVQCYCVIMDTDLTRNQLMFDTAVSTATFINNEAPDDNVWIRSDTYDFSIEKDVLKLTGSFQNEPAKSSGSLSSTYKIEGNTLTLYFDPKPNFIDDEFTLIYKK